MEREEVLAKINELGKEIFDNDTVVIEDITSAEDIDGWDSLTHLELIEALENEYKVKFTMEEILGSVNVGKLVDAILERYNK